MVEDSASKTAVIAASIVVGAVAVAWMLQRTISTTSTSRSEPRKKTKKNHEETWEAKIPQHHGPLREIWPGCLYVLEADGAGQGPPIRNMTIYRPPPGTTTTTTSNTTSDRPRLVIINGIAVRDDTLAAILVLGEPTVLVVPNSMHRDCAKVWKDRFPKLLVVAPAVAVARALEVVPVDMTTQQWAETVPYWNKVVTATEIKGWKAFETVLELDLGSNKKAFVVTDLLFTMTNRCHTDGSGDMLTRFMFWLFDSTVDDEPVPGRMVIPKVSRVARVFGIADWQDAEQWYRTYAKEHGSSVAVICVGHGPPIVEMNAQDGCTAAFVGVADQLTKPRW